MRFVVDTIINIVIIITINIARRLRHDTYPNHYQNNAELIVLATAMAPALSVIAIAMAVNKACGSWLL
jgi:heme/copper-type cytochrome/quinol oxidase subunit 2